MGGEISNPGLGSANWMEVELKALAIIYLMKNIAPEILLQKSVNLCQNE